MNKLLLLLICIAGIVPATASAQDDSTVKLNVAGEGSSKLGSVILTTASEISFADGNMVVTNGSDSQSFSLSEIAELTFDITMSATENISEDLAGDISVSMADGVLTVTVPDGAPVAVSVFSMAGYQVASSAATGTVTIDLKPLAPGAYIIRANQKTIKFIR